MENDPTYARVLHWLSVRALTRAQIQTRLVRQGVDPARADAIIVRLEEQGWVNDVQYAQTFMESKIRQGRMGPHRIRQALAERGIATAIIQEAWDELGVGVNWEEIAETLAKRYDKCDPRAKGRLARHLARQGFSPTMIRRVLERWSEDAKESGEAWH